MLCKQNIKMNRNSGNASKTKKSISEGANNSKSNRKSFQIISESSSISSNRNSSAQSEEDVANVDGAYLRTQMNNNNAACDEQELIVKKLQAQVKELRHKLKIVEESIESKDYSLGTITREKDRAIGEIRRLERSNKQLKQQLNDERNHYLEEKEKFCREMTRCKKRLQEVKINNGKNQSAKWNTMLPISQQSFRWQFNNEKGDFTDNKEIWLKSSKSQKLMGTKEDTNPLGSFSCSDSQIQRVGSLESLHLYDGNDQSLQIAALQTENAKLRSIICERDERNYELCLRFLRMKHCKNDIRTRFQDLENEYLQVITNLMEKIDEARQEFNFIIDQKFKKPLHSKNAMYLRLVQRNSRMAFENASLRVENQCLKKELKKHMAGAEEFERKIDQTHPVAVEEDAKLAFRDSKAESILKRAKKNVNFKEIKTIYQRNHMLKNSDTDSNYMSKTSTTAPSNTSLTDPKSNESITGWTKEMREAGENKIESTFQMNSLPDEILNKIFKRIDTSSCQTLDSCRTKNSNPEIKDRSTEEETKKLCTPFEFVCKYSETKIYEPKEDSRQPTDLDPVDQKVVSDSKFGDVERKTSNFTDSSTTCNSKESFQAEMKNSLNFLPYSPSEFVKLSNKMGGMNEFEKKAYLRPKRQETESLNYSKSRHRVMRHYDKDSAEDGISSLDRSLNSKRSWLSRYEDISAGHEHRNFPVKDSCGLQEKLDISYQELPRNNQSKSQITSKLKEEKRDEGSRETKIESTETKMGEKNEITHEFYDFIEGAGSKKSIDLKLIDEQVCQGENALLASKTYRLENNAASLKNSQLELSESIFSARGDQLQLDSSRSRRSEGSKRFSHRLISTSPEQLKSILTESQMEACYRMGPIIVGHATTEISSGFQNLDSNNDIVLQLVIPAANVRKSSQILTSNGALGKETLEKETSISGLTPVENFSNLPTEIRIPVSNLPTSTSTMEMVDSDVVNDRNNIMLRTLSAPGLLESSWLDPYTICEMRDGCSNT